MSSYKFNLDLHSSQSQVSLAVKQGDTDRSFEITLSDGSEAFILPAYCVATLLIKKPSGYKYTSGCIIKHNSVIEFQFDADVATESGINICELLIFGNDNALIASPNFTMIVSDRAVKTEDIEISAGDVNEFNTIYASEAQRIINEYGADGTGQNAGRVYNEVERMIREDERIAAEEARKNAENERVAAEEARKNADSDRDSNEETRMQNEDVRIANENDRIEAEDERNKAEKKRNDNYETAEKDRNDAYNNAESSRNEEYSLSETDRENSYNSAETTRNTRYNQAEAQRDRAYRQAEAKRDYKSTASAYDALDERVTNIESYINPKYYITAEERAFERIIPANACPYIELNSVGSAYSRVSNNLLNPAGFGRPLTEDGGFEPEPPNHMPEARYSASVYLPDDDFYTVSAIDQNGNIVLCSFETSDGPNTVQNAKGDINVYVFDWKTGTTAIYVMVNRGETALPFERYHKYGPTKVTAIEHYGANLVDEADAFTKCGFTKNNNGYWEWKKNSAFNTGITVFDNPDKISGALSISYIGKAFSAQITDSAVFTFQINYTDATTVYGAHITSNTIDYTLRNFTTDAKKTVKNIRIAYGTVGTFEIKDLIINWGGVAPYHPYSAEPLFIKPIPQAIQNLNGYGFGKIDFDNKKYIQEYDENGELTNPIVTDISSYLKDFDNTLEVQAGGTLRFLNEAKAPILSTISYLAKEGSV
jgi:hypothetical protein